MDRVSAPEQLVLTLIARLNIQQELVNVEKTIQTLLNDVGQSNRPLDDLQLATQQHNYRAREMNNDGRPAVNH